MALFAFIVYLVVIAVIGATAYVKRRDETDDYLLAGRDHGTWLTALSASASSESGWVTLGLVGMGYSEGYSCFWLLPGCLAGYLVNWTLIGPKVNALTLESGAQTVPQLLAARFQAGGRSACRAIQVIAALTILVFLAFYVSAQFTAGGKALQGMFRWPYQVGAAVTAALVISYSVAGGLRAISWTSDHSRSFCGRPSSN